MLATVESLLLIPIVGNLEKAWLTQLAAAADRAIKNYCKQEIESATYVQYFDGNGQSDLVLRWYPVANDSTLDVRVDAGGYYGQASGAFPSTTVLTKGSGYVLVIDDTSGTKSNRGILRRIAGTGSLAGQWWPDNYSTGKLAANRMPYWPRGIGNIKVSYVGGYTIVPADLTYAAQMIIAYMARVLPNGAALSSESLGGYSYSLMGRLSAGQIPELAEVAGVLRYYRDTSI